MPLTLDGVPDELLAEYGFRHGAATKASYRCTDSTAVLLPLAELIVPAIRKLSEGRVRSLLAGVRDGAAIKPVPVFREPGAAQATLLDGMHRWRVSKALGFPAIPCTYLSREDAEGGYCYPTRSASGS